MTIIKHPLTHVGYGYDTRNKVLKVAHDYNNRDIPLDGIHIDVDLQVCHTLGDISLFLITILTKLLVE